MPGYVCNPLNLLCVTQLNISCTNPQGVCPVTLATGATCATPDTFVPCGNGTTTCDLGCRICDSNNHWSACQGNVTIAGQVNGLAAQASLVLANNGSTLRITSNGNFTFAESIPLQSAYAVTVSAQPQGQTCTVTNGSGTATAPVNNILVSCINGSSTTSVPIDAAQSVAFTDTDPRPNYLSGNITIVPALNQNDVTVYNLYWGASPTQKLPSTASIASLAVGTIPLSYALPSNTSLPTGAAYILVFTANAVGEMTTGVSTPLMDNISANAPTPGNSGSLQVSNITGSSFTLSWDFAVDSTTPQSMLEYEVYTSTSNNLDTAANASANGTALTGQVTNSNTFTVTGLAQGQNAYYNVVVTNGLGGAAAYTTVYVVTHDTVAPTPGNTGTLNVTSGTTNLNVSWTAGTDNVTPTSSLQYRVFYSISPNITTVADAINNGMTADNWTTNITSAQIDGLTQGDTYYVNVLVRDASNNKAAYTMASGVFTGVDSTPPVPGNQGILAFSNVTSNSAALNWTRATDNVTPQASLSYRVVTSNSNNIATVAQAMSNGTIAQDWTANITQVNLSGLPSTINYANVLVRDAANNVAAYQSASVNNGSPPTPGSNGVLTISNIAATSATVTWALATESGVQQNTLQYEVVRSLASNINTVANANANGIQVMNWTTNVSTANITGLTNGTTQYVNVVVRDPAANQNVYVTANFTTLDTTPPTPGNGGVINIANVGNQSIGLIWTAASDNVTPSSNLQYEVVYSNSNNLGTVANAASNGTVGVAYSSNMTSATVSGLTTGTPYYFNILVKDAAGNVSIYNTTTATPANSSAPPIPGGSGVITVSAINGNSLQLSWSAASDSVTPTANLQYAIYASNTNNIQTVATAQANGMQVMGYTTNVIGATVSGLSNATTYYFNVLVSDQANNLAAYTSVVATTKDTTPPVPGNSGTLAVASITQTSLSVFWGAASDNATPTASLQYRVYQSNSNNIASVSAAETNGTLLVDWTTGITSDAVTALTAGTTYYFNVLVRDAANNAAGYTTLSATTSPPPDTTPPVPGNNGNITISGLTSTSLTLNWTTGTDNATATNALQYSVYESSSNNIGTPSTATSNGTEVVNWTTNIGNANITGLASSTTYYFNVLIEDASSNVASYTTVAVTTAAPPDTIPPVPGNSGVITTAAVTGTSLTLNWTAGTDNDTPVALLSYRVYQSSSNNIGTVSNALSNGTLVVGPSNNIATANITGLSNVATYYFNVLINDQAGNVASYVSTSATTLDTTPPTPQNSGTLTAASTTSVAFTLNWTAATDNATLPANLMYTVYQSNSNNIGSVTAAQSNGTVLQNYTAAITSYSVSGLTPKSTTYYNVLVKDQSGNIAAYSSLQVVTLPPIYVFSGGTSNGNPGGRSGIDGLCSTAKSATYGSLTCTNVHAIVSATATDEISNMASTYSVPSVNIVYGVNASLATTALATNWGTMVGGTLLNTFQTATGITTDLYTASNASGTQSTNSCTSLTTSSIFGGNLEVGIATSTTNTWISSTTVACSMTSATVICACY